MKGWFGVEGEESMKQVVVADRHGSEMRGAKGEAQIREARGANEGEVGVNSNISVAIKQAR